MAACTSCSAASMLRSSVNCSVICELPKLDTERHLRERRHLAELALERRGHRRGHRLGARAGELRRDHDGRVVDLRQRRDRQLAVADDAREQQADHQQRRRDRPPDERLGDAHGAPRAHARRCAVGCGPGRARGLAARGTTPAARAAAGSALR